MPSSFPCQNNNTLGGGVKRRRVDPPLMIGGHLRPKADDKYEVVMRENVQLENLLVELKNDNERQETEKNQLKDEVKQLQADRLEYESIIADRLSQVEKSVEQTHTDAQTVHLQALDAEFEKVLSYPDSVRQLQAELQRATTAQTTAQTSGTSTVGLTPTSETADYDTDADLDRFLGVSPQQQQLEEALQNVAELRTELGKRALNEVEFRSSIVKTFRESVHQRYKKQNDSQRSENAKLKGEIEAVTSQKDELVQKCSSLEKTLAEQKQAGSQEPQEGEETKRLKAQLQHALLNLESMTKERDQLAEQKNATAVTCKELEEKLGLFTVEIDKARSGKATAMKEALEAKASLSKSEKRLKNCQESNDTYLKQIGELETIKRKNEEELGRKKGSLVSSKTQHKETAEQLNDTQKTLSAMTAALDSERMKLDAAETEMKSLREEFEKEKEHLKRMNEVLAASLADEERKTAQNKLYLKEKEDAISGMHKKIQGAEKKLETQSLEFKGKSDKWSRKLSEMKQALTDKSSEIVDLKGEVEDLKGEIEDLKGISVKKNGEIECLTAEIAGWKTHNEETCKELRKETDAMGRELQQLKMNEFDYVKNVEELKKQQAETEALHSAATEQHEAYCLQLVALLEAARKTIESRKTHQTDMEELNKTAIEERSAAESHSLQLLALLETARQNFEVASKKVEDMEKQAVENKKLIEESEKTRDELEECKKAFAALKVDMQKYERESKFAEQNYLVLSARMLAVAAAEKGRRKSIAARDMLEMSQEVSDRRSLSNSLSPVSVLNSVSVSPVDVSVCSAVSPVEELTIEDGSVMQVEGSPTAQEEDVIQIESDAEAAAEEPTDDIELLCHITTPSEDEDHMEVDEQNKTAVSARSQGCTDVVHDVVTLDSPCPTNDAGGQSVQEIPLCLLVDAALATQATNTVVVDVLSSMERECSISPTL